MCEIHRHRRCSFGLIALCVAMVSGAATAQGLRHALGQRMRALEASWATVESPERRTAALEATDRAVRAFLTLRLTTAARALDEAEIEVLGADDESGAALFVRSLTFTTKDRIIDERAATLIVEADALYEVDRPGDASLELEFSRGSDAIGRPTAVTIPCRLSVDVADLGLGDHQLTLEVRCGAGRVRRTLAFSRVARLEERLAAIDEAEFPGDRARDLTLAELADRIRDWQDGDGIETDVPVARYLAFAETLLDSEVALLSAERPGDFVFVRPRRFGAKEKCRVLVPAQAAADPAKARPLVVLLHGAGGSENIYFDGHGRGLAKRLAEERGWFLAAPKQPLIGRGDVDDLIDELAHRLPIDRRAIFLYGHSLGAMQVIDLADESPGRFGAVAAVSVPFRGDSKSLGRSPLPVYLAAGEFDFSLRGTTELHRRLKSLGKQRLRLDVLPRTEHLLVVVESLPRAFAFFAEVLEPAGSADK